jgi:hypothetical protein
VDTLIAPVDGGDATRAPMRVLGRYLLLQRLGAGGFGEVWRAQDELLRREVAVKRIPCDEDGFAQRAAREAQAAARLSHPAIVALYEAAEQDGAFYLTSELVKGVTLAFAIAEDLLADEEILEVGLALCDALLHAHRRGVIHRDVKPQNILIPDEPADRLGVAKLTDFGGARLDGEQALTRTGDVLGTLAYMAPEQSEGLQAGPEADLYSLALVLYEALTGDNPVRAATAAATVRRIGGQLPSLRRARGDLPRGVAAAIDRALLPNLEDRGTVAELASALRDGLGEVGERPAPDGIAEGVSTAGWVTPEGAGSAFPDSATQLLLPTRQLPVDAGRPAGEDPIGAARTSIAPLSAGDRSLSGRQRTARRVAMQLPALPRVAWAAAAIALLAWQLAMGRPGLCLLLAAGALPLLVAMPRRAGPGWMMPAFAPLLGLAGLGSVFPALCASPSRAPMRGWLGALGYWWLCLAEIGFTRGMAPAVGFSSGFPSANDGGAWARPGWEHSIAGAAQALLPLLSPAVLSAAALWGAGAVALPWLLRGRSVGLDLLLAGTWSAALLAGPGLLAAALQRESAVTAPPAAILGAVLGALLAVALMQVGRTIEPPHA